MDSWARLRLRVFALISLEEPALLMDTSLLHRVQDQDVIYLSRKIFVQRQTGRSNARGRICGGNTRLKICLICFYVCVWASVVILVGVFVISVKDRAYSSSLPSER